MTPPPAVVRVRMRFAKLGKVRFVGHRDVARCWERALRIARLPVSTSGGFTPRARLGFGLALSTGHESLAEYLDVDLDEPMVDAALRELLAAAEADARVLGTLLDPGLPPGLELTGVRVIDRTEPSLQEAVTSSSWLLELPGVDAAVAAAQAHEALAAPTLVVERHRKGTASTDDVRPALRSLTVTGQGTRGAWCECELALAGRALRPGEMAAAVFGTDDVRVLRRHQWIERDGARREPVEATTAPRTPVTVCA